MNDNEDIPNPALRAAVTDHSFVLTLRKSHIAALAHLANYEGTMDSHVAADLARRRDGGAATLLDKCFVVAMRGLGDRGLVEHRKRPNFKGAMLGTRNDRLTDFYRLTRAGWAVYDLLSEAGMVPAIDRRSPKRRLIAA